MIISGLMHTVLSMLNILFGWVSFPSMPSEIDSWINYAFRYIQDGIGFVWLVVPREVVLVALPVIIVVENFDKMYSVVMWIIRKIPMLGIK